MAKEYVPAFTRKLASNTRHQVNDDPIKLQDPIQTLLPKLRGSSYSKSDALEGVNQHRAQEVLARPERSANNRKSGDYLQRLMDAKNALSTQDVLDSGSSRGLPRFLNVGYASDKNAQSTDVSLSQDLTSSSPQPQPQLSARRTASRAHSESPLLSHNRSFSSSTILDFAPPGVFASERNQSQKRFLIATGCTVAVAGFLLILILLSKASKDILETLWLAEMKRQGLSSSFYRVKKI